MRGMIIREDKQDIRTLILGLQQAGHQHQKQYIKQIFAFHGVNEFRETTTSISEVETFMVLHEESLFSHTNAVSHQVFMCEHPLFMMDQPIFVAS